MRKTRLLITTLAATALCAPAGALGAAIVPPGNSAVNQYTQQVPTAGGNVQPGTKKAKPEKVLGKKTSSELDKQGPDGEAAAELATETSAPTVAPVTEETSGADKSGGNGAKGKKKKKHEKAKPHTGKEKGGAAGAGGSSSGTSGTSGISGGSGQGAGAAAGSASGGSALGQIAAQATGTSSGELGWLMPLALVLGLLFCGAYLLRSRRLAS